jgi:hypothetical protein
MARMSAQVLDTAVCATQGLEHNRSLSALRSGLRRVLGSDLAFEQALGDAGGDFFQARLRGSVYTGSGEPRKPPSLPSRNEITAHRQLICSPASIINCGNTTLKITQPAIRWYACP